VDAADPALREVVRWPPAHRESRKDGLHA